MHQKYIFRIFHFQRFVSSGAGLWTPGECSVLANNFLQRFSAILASETEFHNSDCQFQSRSRSFVTARSLSTRKVTKVTIVERFDDEAVYLQTNFEESCLLGHCTSRGAPYRSTGKKHRKMKIRNYAFLMHLDFQLSKEVYSMLHACTLEVISVQTTQR